MTFCLTTTVIKPEQNKPVKNAVILLHGYGGDGKDISMLTLGWKRHLPNTIFLCPNGHEKCPINPSGFQWFDLTKDDPEYIIEQSKKAENILKVYINEIKNKYEFPSLIDGAVYSFEVGKRKPSYDIYKIATEMAGVGAHEALFIDDLSENIIAAKEIGITSLLFTTFEQLKIDLKKLRLSSL